MNSKKLVLFLVLFSCLFTFSLPLNNSYATSKWTPITENDYIFGYTSYKYSCWSGVTEDNPPIIEVFSNNVWVQAAIGQILPAGSDIKSPCEQSYPITVGFTWTVMAPSPPAYQTNRYTALYRPRIPDKEILTKKLVLNKVLEDREKCCKVKEVLKKVPYIAKIKKNGKYVNVIKYKTVKSQEQVTYTEQVELEKSELVDVKSSIPGYIGASGNISIYSSVNAMNADIAKITSGVLCSFGFIGC